jgi:5-methylcytosine-specific restriction protein A
VSTFILTWNPKTSDGDVEKILDDLIGDPTYVFKGRWSTGSRKSGLEIGDTGFLLRQREERGIVAMLKFTSKIYLADDWDDDGRVSGKKVPFADADWTTAVDVDDRLRTETLKDEIPNVSWDKMQGSGVLLAADDATALGQLWDEHLLAYGTGSAVFPNELPRNEYYIEGAEDVVLVNRYERDPRARRDCIAYHGAACAVCKLDFSARYGALGAGYIHVHHLVELSSVGEGYKVDPIKDLRPVCPNCHAMLHRERPALTIEELKKTLTTPNP